MKGAFFALICLSLLFGDCICEQLPEGYVRTPGGFAHHESCVHRVSPNSRVEQLKDGSFLVHEPRDGTIVTTQIAKCTRSPIPPTKQSATPQISQDGYILDAHDYFKCDNCPGESDRRKRQQNLEVGFLGGQWTVPANPQQNGALLYLWNGIVSASGDDVLQPVLQWGSGPAGGGNYWGFASWYVGPAGALHSDYDSPINPGTVITGNTKLIGDKEWLIEGLYNGKNISYSISLAEAGQQFGVYLTLEADSVTTCANYPTDGKCSFVKQKIMNVQGNPLQANWTREIFYQGECGEDVQILSESNVNLVWSNSKPSLWNN